MLLTWSIWLLLSSTPLSMPHLIEKNGSANKPQFFSVPIRRLLQHESPIISQARTGSNEVYAQQTLEQLDDLTAALLRHPAPGVNSFDLKSIIEVLVQPISQNNPLNLIFSTGRSSFTGARLGSPRAQQPCGEGHARHGTAPAPSLCCTAILKGMEGKGRKATTPPIGRG